MALAHILAAISEESKRDRARLEAEARKQRELLVHDAAARAAAVEAEIAQSRDAELQAEAQRLENAARLDATRRRREARERVFQDMMNELERRLSLLRSDDQAYRRLFTALFEEARAHLPEAQTVCIDPRDERLAAELARGLSIEASLSSSGGLMLQGVRCTIDNTLEARIASAMPHLRRLAFEGSGP